MRFKLIESISNIHVFNEIDGYDDIQSWYWDNDGLNGLDGGYGLIIIGNRDFKPMFYTGKYDEEPLKNAYYDSENSKEFIEKLKEITGKDYEHFGMTGYSQSDWQDAYYPKGEFSVAYLAEIEDVYFGMYKNFIDTRDNTSYYTFDNRFAGSVEKQLSEQTGYLEDSIVVKYLY